MVACVLVTVILLGPVQSPQVAGGQDAQIRNADIIAYGATPAGVAATIQARRMGKTAILIEPSSHVGGLTSGGLGATDTGDKSVIGGISREFYRRLKKHYDDPAAWKFGDRSKLPGYRPMEDAIWVFEPKVAEKTLRGMLAEEGVELILGEWLDRAKGGVVMESGRITRIRTLSGKEYSAKVFIDTSYEGDLMAAAGVDYAVGRESNAKYGESLNGWQLSKNVHNHRFVKKVDGFVKPGDPASGRVFGIEKGPFPSPGNGDNRVQAYCFRMCMTQVDSNKVDFAKPEDYDEAKYELLLRNLEAGDLRFPMHPLFMPNGKTDTNNNGAVSTDFIGFSNDYPDASYERRKEIIQAHLSWQKGLMWTLKYHPRSPEAMKKLMAPWGMAKDEFVETGNWPHQIYVREARRMVGAHVMTELECRGIKPLQSPVGMGSYNMDSHNIQRFVTAEGFVRNEGDVQVRVRPYPISYRSLRPRASECTNLLAPACLSSSHIAFGSIRMEPVFMVLGQSAATAAVHAIDERATIQAIDPKKLEARLLKDGQVLDFASDPLPPRTAAKQVNPAGIVVDDEAAQLKGFNSHSNASATYVGHGYLHDGNTNKGEQTARFTPDLPKDARYTVAIAYPQNANRASNVPVIVHHADGDTKLVLDQKKKPAVDGLLQTIGTFRFAKGKAGYVEIANVGTDGYVVIDAVQWLEAK